MEEWKESSCLLRRCAFCHNIGAWKALDVTYLPSETARGNILGRRKIDDPAVVVGGDPSRGKISSPTSCSASRSMPRESKDCRSIGYCLVLLHAILEYRVRMLPMWYAQ